VPGGAGALGALAAGWLAGNGAVQLRLLSRSGCSGLINRSLRDLLKAETLACVALIRYVSCSSPT
jgi:hypothetical protein